ncbi:MAG: hypothetical protein AAGL66_14880, partial [Pseudomonadota bacterium]
MNKLLNVHKTVLASTLLVGLFLPYGAGVSGQEELLNELTAVEASKNLELPGVEDQNTMAEQGRYLVQLLGCASCHTDGALVGKPDPKLMLAGSSIGIAYTNPMVNDFPVRFPGDASHHSAEAGVAPS